MSLCAHSDTLRPLLPHDGSLQCVCKNAKAVSASTVSRGPASKVSATISAPALLDVSISALISSNSCASVEDCFAALRSSSNRARLRAFLPPHRHVVVPPHQLLSVCAQSSMKVPRSVHLFQVLVVVPVRRYQHEHRSVLCPRAFFVAATGHIGFATDSGKILDPHPVECQPAWCCGFRTFCEPSVLQSHVVRSVNANCNSPMFV